jgi:hypothetical protein
MEKQKIKITLKTPCFNRLKIERCKYRTFNRVQKNKPLKIKIMKAKEKTFETFLPVFSGFYNTIWEIRTEQFERDNNVNSSQIEVDYEQYNQDVVKNICEALPSFSEGIIKKIELQNIYSPKEYNFRNDSANVLIEVNTNLLQTYINKNYEELAKYIKQNYTSCSGFISSYSNNISDWKSETKNFSDFSCNGHYLGAILQFILFNMDEDIECNLYYCIEIYEDSYITIVDESVCNLDEYEKKLIASKLLSEMKTEPFGYLQILINETKERVKNIPLINWFDELANNETEFILNEFRVNDMPQSEV